MRRSIAMQVRLRIADSVLRNVDRSSMHVASVEFFFTEYTPDPHERLTSEIRRTGMQAVVRRQIAHGCLHAHRVSASPTALQACECQHRAGGCPTAPSISISNAHRTAATRQKKWPL
ncbi:MULTISPECIES: hypothetical protein [unclassified Xanthomonas]|uniref:hypothetical protein n=1 Tax=unclassified Xanthomonas TaxID=2643310 RepID=UPI0028830330|nr:MULTISPECIES: hypothetical protein [unclassified Xanthomonas]